MAILLHIYNTKNNFVEFGWILNGMREIHHFKDTVLKNVKNAQ